MIRRSFDAAEINPILNDPSVFEAIKLPGIDSVDVAAVIDNPANVLLMAEGGGIIFAQQEPGIYEVHTAFLEQFRGRHAVRASLSAYRWMFTHTDCMILQTKVPAFNKAAEKFCSLVGATKAFERALAWPIEDGFVDLSYWVLAYDDWLRKTPQVARSGRRFHAKIDQEFARLGVADNHPDEDCHDLYVGACVEMVYGGQPEKGIVLYNRWARFSGYAPIALISMVPLLIDIRSAVLLVTGDDFQVVKCRQPR